MKSLTIILQRLKHNYKGEYFAESLLFLFTEFYVNFKNLTQVREPDEICLFWFGAEIEPAASLLMWYQWVLQLVCSNLIRCRESK